jgi:tRNA-splicing ligase RtcB
MAAFSKNLENLVTRLDEVRLSINNNFGIPITLFARADVPIEAAAVVQLLEFVTLQQTLIDLKSAERNGATFWGERFGEIKQIVLTPDFHKGSGIPVGTVVDARGFVIPQAVGNDICCGMRLLVTDITPAELLAHQANLAQRLRAIFFQGQRELPLSPRQREALLREGLWGLWETYQDNAGIGLWRYYDAAIQSDDLSRVHFLGVLPTNDTFGFEDYIRSAGVAESYDSQIGSVGGGNHFVEIQSVEEIYDGAVAHQWGVARGKVAIMIHSGSVGLGHLVGGRFREKARAIYPVGLSHPRHGFYVLPAAGPHAQAAENYLDAMRNAANFAFGNRLFLGLMALRALAETLGREVSTRLIYDAPHNLIWPCEDDEERYLHRKGACPALAAEPSFAGAFAYTGHPVIIPGSMGAASYLLAGNGNESALASACHGAGRSLTRGRARNVDAETYSAAIAPLKVITPIDPDAAEVRMRRDILTQYHDHLKEEAPYAYKEITPVIATIEEAAIARRVARLWPLMTIKG